MLNPLRPYEPVKFPLRGKTYDGHVVSTSRIRIRVITVDGHEYKVPTSLIERNERLGPRRDISSIEYQRLMFIPGDEVEFSFEDRHESGMVLATNRRHALVTTGADVRFSVPYTQLQLTRDAEELMRRALLLEETATKASSYLDQQNLFEWSFDFDRATNRAGLCRFEEKVVVLSSNYCIRSTADEIHDTILHEIAHALVGPAHRHDRTWREQALAIGCSADVSSALKGIRTRYIKHCVTCRWAVRAQRRNSRLVCAQCGSRIEFVNYTPEAWANFSHAPKPL